MFLKYENTKFSFRNSKKCDKYIPFVTINKIVYMTYKDKFVIDHL